MHTFIDRLFAFLCIFGGLVVAGWSFHEDMAFWPDIVSGLMLAFVGLSRALACGGHVGPRMVAFLESLLYGGLSVACYQSWAIDGRWWDLFAAVVGLAYGCVELMRVVSVPCVTRGGYSHAGNGVEVP